jgi:hypothetical protein
MVSPNLSPPVDRRTVFAPALQETSRRSYLDPDEFVTTHESVNGADESPNDPQRFRPVPCEDSCCLFAGFSLAACLARCRL